MPGDLKIEKKKQESKKKQTNKQTKKRKVQVVIMENEIRAASKHVPVVQMMAIALSTSWASCSNVGYRYPSDKSLPSG